MAMTVDYIIEMVFEYLTSFLKLIVILSGIQISEDGRPYFNFSDVQPIGDLTNYLTFPNLFVLVPVSTEKNIPQISAPFSDKWHMSCFSKFLIKIN